MILCWVALIYLVVGTEFVGMAYRSGRDYYDTFHEIKWVGYVVVGVLLWPVIWYVGRKFKQQETDDGEER